MTRFVTAVTLGGEWRAQLVHRRRWWPELWRGRLAEGVEPMRVEEYQEGQHPRGPG
jgi:hypothetical protein